jgi:dihydrofolate reductase
MRPLRYSINVTLDGCVDHMAGIPDQRTHEHARLGLERADAMLLGRTTYGLMENAWRPSKQAQQMPEWTDPFAEVINAAKKYVVSSTLEDVDWNAQLIQGDVETAVRALKDQPGNGLATGGVTLPTALAELGLIDEYEVVVHPRVAGHGPWLLAGLSAPLDLELIDQVELSAGFVVLTYVPKGDA